MFSSFSVSSVSSVRSVVKFPFSENVSEGQEREMFLIQTRNFV